MEDGEEENSKNRYAKVKAEPKELIRILEETMFLEFFLDFFLK